MGQNRNLELPDLVDELLDSERGLGSTITSTVSAAIYWYFNRLESAQRELARRECREWMDTGKMPPSAIATEIEQALRNARERGLRRLRRQSADGG